eukprot:16445204-Heterocapsa_arctica.AAC.1
MGPGPPQDGRRCYRQRGAPGTRDGQRQGGPCGEADRRSPCPRTSPGPTARQWASAHGGCAGSNRGGARGGASG